MLTAKQIKEVSEFKRQIKEGNRAEQCFPTSGSERLPKVCRRKTKSAANRREPAHSLPLAHAAGVTNSQRSQEIDERIYKSNVSDIMKSWKKATTMEYQAMMWMALKLRDRFMIIEREKL